MLARKYYTTVGQGLAPAADKDQITVRTGLAPVRKKLYTSHIDGQPQGLSLRVEYKIIREVPLPDEGAVERSETEGVKIGYIKL